MNPNMVPCWGCGKEFLPDIVYSYNCPNCYEAREWTDENE